jgi:hypothetical protein
LGGQIRELVKRRSPPQKRPVREAAAALRRRLPDPLGRSATIGHPGPATLPVLNILVSLRSFYASPRNCVVFNKLVYEKKVCMIINQSLKFIFIHIPRSGGTSLTESLSAVTKWCDIEIGSTEFGEYLQPAYLKRFNLRKHIPSFHLQEIIGHAQWASYFSFTSVRSPYSRFVSVYNLLKFSDSFKANAYADYVRSFSGVNDFIANGQYLCEEVPDYMFLPQVYWIGDHPDYSLSTRLIVNKTYQIENIKIQLPMLYSKIGLDVTTLDFPVSNSVSADNEKLDDRSVAIINEVYKKDFELLGYAMK